MAPSLHKKLLLQAALPILAGLFVFSGCASPRAEPAWGRMLDEGASHALHPVSFNFGIFELAGMMRTGTTPETALVVYIEGDGHTLNENNELTDDPTPETPLSFLLAVSDPAPKLLYLARIGQFNKRNTGNDYKKYWGNARFSVEAVLAANQAIDRAKSMAKAEKIHLIGFSGGGGLAVILAEQRKDVASLVTVAGLLDTGWWVQEYLPSKVRKDYSGAFSLSINPADHAAKISGLPQMHFSGSKDTEIPMEMVDSFEEKTPFLFFRHIILPCGHNEGWTAIWPQVLESYALPLRAQKLEIFQEK